MTRFSILAFVILSAVLANQATAQPGGGGWPWGCSTTELQWNAPGECTQLPLDWCNVVTLLEIHPAKTVYDLTPVVESITNEGETTIEGFCGYLQDCGSMPPPTSWLQVEETVKEVCWEVGAGASVTAKSGLATRLIAAVNASVEINGQMSGCITTSARDELMRFIPNCFDSTFWEEVRTLSVTGTVSEIPGGIRIRCDCDGTGPEEFDVWCDATAVSSGDADNVASVTFKRDDEPCCVDPPMGPPCCGCGAGS